MFRGAAKLFKQFIMLLNHMSTVLYSLLQFDAFLILPRRRKGGRSWCLQPKTGQICWWCREEGLDHKNGIREVVCPGLQCIALQGYLLLLLSSMVLLLIFTVVNLWVSPIPCPLSSSLISLLLPT